MSKIKAIELVYLLETLCESMKQTVLPVYTINSMELIDDEKNNKVIILLNYNNILVKKEEVLSHSIKKLSLKELNEIIKASIQSLEKNEDESIEDFVDESIKVMKALIKEEDKEDEKNGK